MHKKSIYLGIFLILLGLLLFLITGASGKTALFVSGGFGVLFVLFGTIAIRYPLTHKHMMHLSAFFALFGSLGSLGRGIPGLFKEMSLYAVWGQIVMGLSCLIFLIFCIQSFILARKINK